VFLVDDDHPHIGQRRDDGQTRPDDDVDVARSDPAPFVGALTFAEPRMDEGDPRIEVGPQPVDEREGEGDLRHQDERRASRLERRGDRLDVDRCLAAARHPIEQQRARVTGGDRGHDPVDRLGLGRQEVAGGGSAAPAAGRSFRQRSARALADLGLHQAASHEPGGRGRPVAGGQLGGGQLTCLGSAELGQQVDLARAERAARDRLPRGQHGDRHPPRIRQPDPAFIARPGAGAQQRPAEAHPALGLERPETTQQTGATVGAGEVTDGPWAAGELVKKVQHIRVGPGGRIRSGGTFRSRGPRPIRCQFGDQFEPFEQPRRQHRAQDEGRRRQVVPRDRRGESQRQRRQQRSICADPIDDRLHPGRGGFAGLSDDDPERLAPSELDQDRFTELQIG
jgi:hypothetical protein